MLSGRQKSHPPKCHQMFPIGNFKFQIEFQIKCHQKFHKHTSAGLAALSEKSIPWHPSFWSVARPFFKMGSIQGNGLVGKCSATRYSVAAPPPGVQQGFGGPMHPRHLPAVAERGATGAFGGGVAATPLLHTQNCGMSRDRGAATPWSATGGGCSVCPH